MATKKVANLVKVDDDYYLDVDPEELGAAITSLLGEACITPRIWDAPIILVSGIQKKVYVNRSHFTLL